MHSTEHHMAVYFPGVCIRCGVFPVFKLGSCGSYLTGKPCTVPYGHQNTKTVHTISPPPRTYRDNIIDFPMPNPFKG